MPSLALGIPLIRTRLEEIFSLELRVQCINTPLLLLQPIGQAFESNHRCLWQGALKNFQQREAVGVSTMGIEKESVLAGNVVELG